MSARSLAELVSSNYCLGANDFASGLEVPSHDVFERRSVQGAIVARSTIRVEAELGGGDELVCNLQRMPRWLFDSPLVRIRLASPMVWTSSAFGRSALHGRGQRPPAADILSLMSISCSIKDPRRFNQHRTQHVGLWLLRAQDGYRVVDSRPRYLGPIPHTSSSPTTGSTCQARASSATSERYIISALTLGLLKRH